MTNSEIKKPCLNCKRLTDNIYLNGVILCAKCVMQMVIEKKSRIEQHSEINCEHNSRLCKSGAEWCRSCGGFSLNYGETWELPTRTPEPTKAENGLVRLDEKALSEFIGEDQGWEESAVILAKKICAKFGTPSITKEQLLAILPEKAVCKHQKYDDECGCWTRNNAIDQMKQRIEELWK